MASCSTRPHDEGVYGGGIKPLRELERLPPLLGEGLPNNYRSGRKHAPLGRKIADVAISATVVQGLSVLVAMQRKTNRRIKKERLRDIPGSSFHFKVRNMQLCTRS